MTGEPKLWVYVVHALEWKSPLPNTLGLKVHTFPHLLWKTFTQMVVVCWEYWVKKDMELLICNHSLEQLDKVSLKLLADMIGVFRRSLHNHMWIARWQSACERASCGWRTLNNSQMVITDSMGSNRETWIARPCSHEELIECRSVLNQCSCLSCALFEIFNSSPFGFGYPRQGFKGNCNQIVLNCAI